MPHDIFASPDLDRNRSLGWLAIAWMEYFTVHGSGDVSGESVAPIIDEYCGFLVDSYALDEKGKRLHDHLFLSRPKGCSKSEMAALVGLFEALGPCRFDGWAKGGEVFRDEWGLGFEYKFSPNEPLGKRLKDPFIRCVSTESDQAGLVYDTIYLNLTEGPLRGAMPKSTSAGLTRIAIPGGGEIVPSSSSASSKDGGKDTLTLLDETHLFNKPELRQMYKTLTRNLVKRRKSAETFALETSTMYAPGENSVAEQTYKLVQDARDGKLKKFPRQLLDHRYGDITPQELGDEVKVRAALVDSYGDCAAWNDIDGLVDEVMSTRNDVSASLRYWMNSKDNAAEDSWVAQYEWDACGPIDGDTSGTAFHVKPGDTIVLGFDGSRRRRRGVTDATALIGCRVSDGLLFEVKVWEQPPGVHEGGWEVPVHDVKSVVAQTFNRYDVVGFYCDPALFEVHVAEWEARYGPRLKVKASQSHPCEFWMVGSRALKTVQALREFVDAVLDIELHHDGSPTLRAHVLNARRRVTTQGTQIAKENPDSPNKIDAAVAAVLAWQARLDAVSKGIGPRRKRMAKRVR